MELGDAETGAFDAATRAAIRRFQDARGLASTGACDRLTWATLVEAGYRLGDRLLYLRTPMLRGDDVADLQQRLGTLGFDAGWVDGILGPATERALKDFQRNAGLTTDGVLGRDTQATLLRLGRHASGPSTVASLREQEQLKGPPRSLHGQQIAVGEPGGLGILVAALERRLTRAGALVLTLHHPDPSEQAQEANRFGAVAYVGLAAGDLDEVWYFRNRSFESSGGRALADLLAGHATEPLGPTGTAGRWHPILRETRMPAVQWNLGRGSRVASRSPELADVAHGALQRWFDTDRTEQADREQHHATGT